MGQEATYSAALESRRITADPALMAGVPTIRGMRIPVATVVQTSADGVTVEETLRELPDLEPEDVTQALLYSASSSESTASTSTAPDADSNSEA